MKGRMRFFGVVLDSFSDLWQDLETLLLAVSMCPIYYRLVVGFLSFYFYADSGSNLVSVDVLDFREFSKMFREILLGKKYNLLNLR
jgi:hypothetical protein